MVSSILFGKERMDTNAGVTLEHVVKSSGRLPDTFIYLLNGRPVPMTYVIVDSDIIEAVRIASGG